MGRASRRKRLYRTGDTPFVAPAYRSISRRDALFGTVLLLLLLGWVGYLLFDTVGRFRSVAVSVGWPTVQGEVLGRRVEAVSGWRGRTFFHPLVSYRYRVDGQGYDSTTYRLHPQAAEDRVEAERLIAAYTTGSPVRVFYNPNAPGEAYLAASFLTSRDYIGLAVLVVSFVFLLAITLLVCWPEPMPLRLRKAGRSIG